MWTSMLFILLVTTVTTISANPDAKRLYDDLLSNYNRLIRPVSNNTEVVMVKLGLRLSQLIELVSNLYIRCVNVVLQNWTKIYRNHFKVIMLWCLYEVKPKPSYLSTQQ